MRSGHPSLNAPPSVRASRGFGVAELSLLGVAFMFGLTFVLTQQAIERLPVTAFLAYRFLPAAVLVALLSAMSCVGCRVPDGGPGSSSVAFSPPAMSFRRPRSSAPARRPRG